MKKVLVVILMAFLLVACKSSFNTAPILNINDQPVQGTMSMPQMEKCIMMAGSTLGWKMKKVKNGLIEASHTTRENTAVVDILYSPKSYSIVYKNSINMYEEGGTIHKTYNRWVKNLDKQINSNVVAESYSK